MKKLSWLLGLFLLWLVYLLFTVLNFPIGTLSDNADGTIVLGAAAYNTKPSPVFAERINHAINLYHAGKVSKLIFTGGIGDSTPDGKIQLAESVVVRDYAISKKINHKDIFIETESLTTKENLMYAMQILERENIKTVLVISDSLHLKRAMLMAKDLGIQAKSSATPTRR